MRAIRTIAHCAAAVLGLGFALLVGLPGALAEPRVALVIGNADYGNEIGRLANPANDAALMKKSLTQAGFDVIEITDADQKAMKRAISEFGKRLTAAGPEVTALFYYSGHGLQVGGDNYLIPVNAQIAREADVDLEAVSADTVLKQMQFADARVNIIILDACRNNPLPRTFKSAQMGLARIEAPRGSFVAYSTAPGDVASDGTGKNSPYTAALATAIITPGLSIEEAFRTVRGSVLSETGNAQTPWESSSLTAPFFFMPAQASVPPVTPAGNRTAPAAADAAEDQRAVELIFWNSVKDSKDPADFAAYLEQFPKGNFAKLAQNRLTLLSEKPVTPDKLAKPAGTQASDDQRALEFAFWDEVKDSRNPADFNAYLEKFPEGNFVELAQVRLAKLSGTPATKSANQVPTQPTVSEAPAAADTAEAPAAEPEQNAGAAVDVPIDPDAAEKMCRDENADAAHRLGACQNALHKNGLDDAQRGDLTNEVGRAYYDLQKYPEAQEKYRAAIALDPAEPVYPANLGLALSDAGDYAGAVTAYDLAIKLDPKNSWHFYNRGFAKLYSNDPPGAGADLDAALALEESFDLLSARGFIALAEGNAKAAVDFTMRAIGVDGSSYGLQSIAVLYLAERDKDALAMTDRLIANDQGYGYGQIWKALLLTRQGKSGAARTLLSETLKAHGSDWPGMLLRWMLGKFDDEMLLRKAHEGTGQDIQNQLCEANFYLGERYLSKGDKMKAAAYFAATLETKVYHYIEYYTAAAFLERLKAGN